ncbi:MAG: lipocalin family protein, partial [Rubrivivax sp.]
MQARTGRRGRSAVTAGWIAALAAAFAAPAVLASSAAPAAGLPAPQALASLEVPPYMGTWYQVALFPNRFQAQCVSDT